MNRYRLGTAHALKRIGCEEGQTLTEYALILIFIAIVVIPAVTTFGGQIVVWFNAITAIF